MSKVANGKITLATENAIKRLDTLINELGLEMYENPPNPNDEIIEDIIAQIEKLIESLKQSNFKNVTFFQLYVNNRKSNNNSLHIVLPHSEIIWKKFASIK